MKRTTKQHPYYLFLGRTCVNSRSPIATLDQARASVQLRQEQDRNLGFTVPTYTIACNGQRVEDVAPEQPADLEVSN